MDSTEVPSIVEFLTSRLDELERWASRCATLYPSPWDCSDRGCMAAVRADAPYFPVVAELNQDHAPAGTGVWLGEYLQHIAAHDPAFVLADIAAKRKIITLAIELDRMCDAEWGDGADPLLILWPQDRGYDGLRIVKALALPFAGHPDYQPAWAA